MSARDLLCKAIEWNCHHDPIAIVDEVASWSVLRVRAAVDQHSALAGVEALYLDLRIIRRLTASGGEAVARSILQPG